MDPTSKTQSQIQLLYIAFVGSFCFPFMIHTVNPPDRSVSPWVLVASVVVATYAVGTGFVMRKKFFRKSTEALPSDLHKALNLWRVAHIFGFTCAMNLTVFAAVLRFLGSSLLVPGIFFGLSLMFLVLSRPRQFAVCRAQPTR